MRGARAVRTAVVDAFPEADISVSIIWIDILLADNEETSRDAVKHVPDARVRHFHDPKRLLGRALAPRVGMPAMLDIDEKLRGDRARLETIFNHGFVAGPGAAFDTAFFYPPGVRWKDEPPEPMDWFTQLDPSAFTGVLRERFQWGDAFDVALRETMQKLFKNDPPAPVPNAPPPSD